MDSRVRSLGASENDFVPIIVCIQSGRRGLYPRNLNKIIGKVLKEEERGKKAF